MRRIADSTYRVQMAADLRGRRAANLRTIVDDLRSQGITSVRTIAAELNARDILTLGTLRLLHVCLLA